MKQSAKQQLKEKASWCIITHVEYGIMEILVQNNV